MRPPIQKALTFRASSIGDCLMGKYLLDNVHAQFPSARLGIVVASRGAMIRDLFAAYPWIEIVEVNRRNPSALWHLRREWRNSDLVVTQYAGKPGGRFSLPSKLAARVLARRGGLFGFTDSFSGNRFIFDHLVPFDATLAPAELERRALAMMGIPISLSTPTLVSSGNDTLSRFRLRVGRYVLVHLFSGSNSRGLSPANRKRLVEELAGVVPSEVDLVLTGSPHERAEAREAAQGTRCLVLAEKTSLQDIISLVAESHSVVAVDTGVAHIAAHLRIPLAVLSSCVGIHWWGKEQYGSSAPIRVFTKPEPNRHIAKEFPDCINTVDFSAVAHYVAVSV